LFKGAGVNLSAERVGRAVLIKRGERGVDATTPEPTKSPAKSIRRPAILARQLVIRDRKFNDSRFTI
jgi:hypothetical protein